MIPPPHPVVEGYDEQDYYRGRVARATTAQADYAAARAAEDDSPDGEKA